MKPEEVVKEVEVKVKKTVAKEILEDVRELIQKEEIKLIKEKLEEKVQYKKIGLFNRIKYHVYFKDFKTNLEKFRKSVIDGEKPQKEYFKWLKSQYKKLSKFNNKKLRKFLENEFMSIHDELERK